ncbi:MAG: hypothetical protein ACLFNP_01805 [Spirochaetaceae bacterium]
MAVPVGRWMITLLSLVSLLPLGAVGMAEESQGAESTPEMPVSRVVLFTSGVAYVEHAETVTGEVRRELTFPTEGMDDLLKSLVIRDLDGGQVGAVSYGAEEPLLRQLEKLPVDISDAPSVEELLRRIRGHRVRLHTAEGREESGALFGVERRPRGSEAGSFLFVTILESGTLRSYKLDEIEGIRLEDEQLQADLDRALSLLAGQKSDTQRRVSFSFLGEGERRVRVAYVREAPLWKLSYRLATEGDEALLQGWAIVENSGTQPWEGVRLSLVSGAPRSFVMSLFAPRYVERPRFDAPSGSPAATPRPPAAAFRSESFAEAEEALDFADGTASDIGSGVEPGAEARERGEFVEYAVPVPVSMGPGEAAMLPVIQEELAAKKLSVYEHDGGVHPRHAVEIENSTELLLQAGAVTVFDEGTYGGDAILQNLPAGERGILVYAVDLETEVVTTSQSEPERITAIEARGGTLLIRRSLRRSVTQELSTSDRAGRTVRVVYPRETNWVLQSPTPSRTVAGSYYFDVPLSPGRPRELTIEEERVVSQSVAVRSLTEETIGFYLRQGHLLSPQLRSGLEELARAQERLAQVRREGRNLETQIEAIFRAQDRIRQNMEVLESGNRLYENYVDRLEEQERELTRLERLRQERRQEEMAAEREVEERIRSLSRLSG